jgi:KDO2-lipid IV(A) lauroyltransferase
MAATSTATARLAKISQAPVVPFCVLRRKDGSGYDLELQSALQDFPSGDDLEDAVRINGIFEEWIRKQPEDYFWFHRRFKQRPPGESSVYD